MITKPISVLLIEDNQGDARLLQEYLREGAPDQFTLVHTKKLSTGLKRLAKEKPDVVLLDLDLPDSQGLDTFKKVYAQAPNMPIVVLTGMRDSDQAIAAVQAGAQDYLAKGELNSNMLVRAILYAIERKRDERELKKEKEIAQQYLDIAGVILVAFDVDGKITLINKKGCEILGYQADEIIGKRWIAKCVPKKMRSDVENVFAKSMAGEVEAVERHENPVLTKSGEERLIAWNNSVLLDETGAIAGILSSGEDITERRRMEEALRESEEKFRKAFEHASIGKGMASPQGKFIDANRAFCEMLGYSKEELRERTWQEITHPNDLAQSGDYVNQLFEGDIPSFKFEHRVLHKNGHTVWIDLNVILVRDWNGHPLYVVGDIVDITVRKLAEEALQQQAAELVAINTLGRAVTANLEMQETTRAALEGMLDTVQCDLAFFFLRDGDRLILEEVLPANSKQRLGDIPEHRVGECMCGLAVREKKALYSQDIHNDSRCTWEECKRAGFKSFAALPLMSGDEVVGVIGLASDTERDFERQSGFLETLAGQVSVGLVNAQLYKTSQRELEERKRAEAQLKLQSAALESAANGILITDREGNISWVNPAFTRLTGYSAEQAIGQTPRILKSGQQDEAYYKKLWDTVLAGEVWSGKLINRRKDGTLYTEEQTITPLKDEAGEISHFISIRQDVTARVQAEQALQESETRFKQLAEAIEDVFTITDLKSWSVLYANPAYEKLWRQPVQELYEDSERWAEGIHPEDRQRVQKAWKQMAKRGGIFDEQYRVIHPDGSMRWVRDRGYPIRDESGQIYRIAAIVQDITARVQAEQALQESEARFKQIAEAIEDIFVLTDVKNWSFLYVSPAYEKILGRPVQDLYDDARRWREAVHPDDRQRTMEAWERMKERGGIYEEEYRVIHTDGSVRWVRNRRYPIRDESGQIYRIAAIVQDITERVQAEAVIKRATDEIKRLYRASGALLASASPNLQSLGQAIVGAVLVEFEHTNCSLILAQPGSQQLKRLAAAGPFAGEVSKGKISLDGPGLVPQAVRSGQIIYAPDVTQNPEYVPNWKSARSELVVPLKVDSRIVGVIDIQSSEIGAFTPDDERLLSLFAERAALALENARLFREANQRLERLTSLREVDQAITSSLDLRVTMGVLLGHILRQLEVDAAAVLLYHPNRNNLEFVAGQGFRTNVLQSINLRLDQVYVNTAALERRIINIPDLGQRETGFLRSPELRAEQFVAYIGVPLIAKGVVVGVLEIYHRQPLDPDPEWMEYLETLAGQAAIAIDNINLFVNLQSSNEELVLAYDATIEGWAQALELRDMEVEGHSRRVVDLTIKLARDLGIGENEMANIYRGALLHDIGKMGVSDAILQKPGKLNEEEWQIMRRHPVFAQEWLSPIRYLQHALDIPYCHHERWNGSGYPRGLKGEQIPLAARIFAVVDVWDALRSDRPYRKAWSKKKALKHIQEQSGIHFDPQVVEFFLKHIV